MFVREPGQDDCFSLAEHQVLVGMTLSHVVAGVGGGHACCCGGKHLLGLRSEPVGKHLLSFSFLALTAVLELMIG